MSRCSCLAQSGCIVELFGAIWVHRSKLLADVGAVPFFLQARSVERRSRNRFLPDLLSRIALVDRGVELFGAIWVHRSKLLADFGAVPFFLSRALACNVFRRNRARKKWLIIWPHQGSTEALHDRVHWRYGYFLLTGLLWIERRLSSYGCCPIRMLLCLGFRQLVVVPFAKEYVQAHTRAQAHAHDPPRTFGGPSCPAVLPS